MHLGDPAPDFTAWTSAKDDEPLHFHRWLGDSWCILFSHPADFTPVCTTELAALARLHPEFTALNCKVLGLSTDSVETHRSWIQDIDSLQAEHKTKVRFPIIADEDLSISKLYGMLDSPLHDQHNLNMRTGMPLTVRTVFIIDPKRTIRLMLTYPAAVGRDFGEILRCVKALKLVTEEPVATPADWRPGQEVIVRVEVTDEQAQQHFSHMRTVKPYLRFVDLSQPSKTA